MRAVEDAGEFTGENYLAAIPAIAEASRAQVAFSHIDFLSELERQIINDESPLSFLNINEGSFNRVNLCPDGGRLLSIKDDQSSTTDITGTFRFEECNIDEIFLDGNYSSRLIRATETQVIADVDFGTGFRIIGVDGASTTFSGSVRNDIEITSDSTGVDVFTSTTFLTVRSNIAIPNGDVLLLESFVTSTEQASADDLLPTDVIPADSYTVELRNVRASIDDDTQVVLSATTSTDLAEAPEGSTFEQGEIDFTISSRTNRLTVQAANGDPTNFDAFILETDNSVVSFVVPWDSGAFEFGPEGKRIPLSLITE